MKKTDLIICLLLSLILWSFLSINLVGSIRVNGQRGYTLTVKAVGDGSVKRNPDHQIYQTKMKVKLTAIADQGWIFTGWSGDLTGDTNPEFITMDGDKIVTATFIEKTPTQYTLSVSKVGNGTVTLDPVDGIYDASTVVTLTANPDTGWIFSGWSGDLSGSTSPEFISMDDDKSVIATFNRKQYTLTVNRVGSGNVELDPNKTAYNYGETVQLTATAATGWIFSGWSGDLSVIMNPTLITIDVDKSVTATFTQNKYILIVNISPSGSGSVTKDPDQATYKHGTQVTVTADPDPGWSFDHWVLDSTNVGGTNPYTLNIKADGSLTAIFKDVTAPTITITSPLDITYSSSELSLKFFVSEPTSWIGYSLDEKDNVTISGNTTIVKLSNGVHDLVVYANDAFGNMGVSGRVNFAVQLPIDTIPPTITITSPEKTTYSTSNVFLEFTINEEISWIGYSLDNQDNVTITGDSVLSNLSEGSHSLVVYATDIGGNVGKSDVVQFSIAIPSVDTTPPLVKINSPSENSTYTSLPVDLNFNIIEQVSWMAYSLDGSNNITISGNATLSSLSEGSHSIVVFATDTAGNTGGSRTIQFTIANDTTPPTITISSPQEKSYSTSEVTLNYTINEPVTWTAYSLDGQENVTITAPITISGLPVGSHTITVFANDTAGNTGSSDLVQFNISIATIDTTPPTIVINSPINTTYDRNQISLSFQVNEEPTLKYYSLDGEANTTVVDSIVLSDLSDGEHRLIMYAKDLSGNIGASQQVTFTITKSNADRQLWIVGVIWMVAFTGFLFSTHIAYNLFKNRHK